MTRMALHACCAIVLPSATMHVQNYSGTGSGIKRIAVAESAFQDDTRSVCIIRATVSQHFNSIQRRAGLSAIVEPFVG